MSEVNKFEQFLNRLSFRELSAGSPDSESGSEVQNKVGESKDRISGLRNSKMQEINENFSEHMGFSLFDNEDYSPPPDLTTIAMGEEDDRLTKKDEKKKKIGKAEDNINLRRENN